MFHSVKGIPEKIVKNLHKGVVDVKSRDKNSYILRLTCWMDTLFTWVSCPYSRSTSPLDVHDQTKKKGEQILCDGTTDKLR